MAILHFLVKKKDGDGILPNPDEPTLVAQLDARPTGNQEVAGLTPARLATFFCGDKS